MELKQDNIASLSKILSCPIYDRKSLKTGIVHIGVGGFHRSHQAYYIHQLLQNKKDTDWAICGIGLRPSDKNIAEVFEKQDCLYTLITQHPNGEVDKEVIGSINEYILGTESPLKAIEKMVDPDTKIVSLTITEGGYNFNPATGEFDFDNPDILHDLTNPDHPKSVYGFLTAALRQRRDKGLPAFTILSCDNIQHNGDVARKMLLSFVNKHDSELGDWVAKEVSFPNSMVDRITPQSGQEVINYLKDECNINDRWPVICEPFIQWVIEDKFSNGRPMLEELGVQFVPDVTPYEKMKIRLLNAGHSVLGIPGAVHGHQTIDECMRDHVFAKFMRQFMDQEVTPILGVIEGIDLEDYKNSLEDRFANPNLKDSVSRICSESSAKLPKFLIPTLEENLATDRSIKYATLLLATWCFYSDKRIDENNQPIEIIDVQKDSLHQAAMHTKDDFTSFLHQPEIFGSLITNERFTTTYKSMIEKLYSGKKIRTVFEEVID